MKKVALYARVSTEAQEQQKTKDSQLDELREICKDFHIVKEYVDEGWSGETLVRPALDRLRDDAKEGFFEAVYIHSPDRLARKYIYQGIVLEELEKEDIEVNFLDKKVSDDPEDQLHFGLLGLIAQYEKAKILERTRRGRIYKARKKGMVGHIPAYGLKYFRRTSEKKDGYFKINKKEAEIVDLIFDLYIEFQSISRVQKELLLRNIETRAGNKIWSRSTIGDMLRDEIYVGRGYYGKRQSVETDNGKKYSKKVKTGARLRDRSEWIPLKFPALIDENIFNLVQRILSKKYKPFGKSKHFYLLSGLCRCANCNSTFVGSKTGDNVYYECSDRRKQFPLPQKCRVKFMRAGDLDNAVWKEIDEKITKPETLLPHIFQLADNLNDKESLENKKQKLIRRKNCVNLKKKRLDDLYYGGLKTVGEWKERTEEFNREENKVDDELKDVEIRLSQIISKPLIIESVKYFCNLAKQKLKNMTSEQRQRFLRFLIEKIILDSNRRKAKIIGLVPTKIEPVELQKIIDSRLETGLLSVFSKAYASPWKMG